MNSKPIKIFFNSEYSLLQSTFSIEYHIKETKKNNQEFLVITEHNNFFSLPDAYKKAIKNNIKVIFGLDLDVEFKNKKFRILIFPKSFNQLLNLFSLSSKKLENKSIDIEEIIDEDFLFIDNPIYGFKSIFGEFLPFENIYYDYNPEKIDKSLDIDYYDNSDDKNVKILEIFSEMRKEKNKIFKKTNRNLSDEIIKKTNNLIKNCYFELPKKIKEIKLPKFSNEKESFKELQKIIKDRLEEKYNKKFKNKEQALERIKFELTVIKEMNLADYFLIIFDLIKFAKENDIYIGPGRGSSAGSIICFLLNITEINPLEHDLLFERFLNLERISMPDIDIDIQDNKREEIFLYLKKKYGEKNFSFITTFQRMNAKSSLKDIARGLGISFGEINEITKLMEKDFPLENYYDKNVAFRAKIESSEKLEKTFELAKKIQNFPRQTGIHAAGVLLSNKPINQIIPTYIENGNLVTQFSMEHLEEWGLLKIDLLGLKTLTIIKNIVNEVQKENKLFKLENINFNDEKTLKLLSEGDTVGIFQLESKGMIETLKKVKVSKFSDLVDIISLFRPGPMQNINKYIENKNNPLKIEKIEEKYDEIVKQTNGIIIYQEQIMKIAQHFSGMSYSKADLLRKAIGKKNKEEINKLRTYFVDSTIMNGHKEKDAVKIYNEIEKFAQYGFNKAHAVSYATISYQMAFLKTRFPKYFYCSILNTLPTTETLKLYITELKKYGFDIVGPNINKSNERVYYEDNKIIMPLTLIKGFGSSANEKLIIERNKNGSYKSFFNFVARAKFVGITDSIIKILILSNSLREFGNMTTLINNLEKANIYYQNISFKNEKTNEMYLDFETIKELKIIKYDIDIDSEIEEEIKYLGNIFSTFPTLKYEGDKKLSNLSLNIEYIIYVYISGIKERKNKNGEAIGVLEVFDSTKNEVFFIHSELWNNIGKSLKQSSIIKCHIIKKRNFRNELNFDIKKVEVVNEK